jgi:hypothetical protein
VQTVSTELSEIIPAGQAGKISLNSQLFTTEKQWNDGRIITGKLLNYRLGGGKIAQPYAALAKRKKGRQALQ